MPIPDPADCANPVCASKSDAVRQMMGSGGRRRKSSASASAGSAGGGMKEDGVGVGAAGGAGVSGGAGGGVGGVADDTGCPLDREELGNSTWELLHTMAAYYPDAPSAVEQRHAAGFVHGLAQLYPCTHCAADFRDGIAAAPPAVGSRTAFSKWACAQHNSVNEKLGKPAYPCTMEALMARWRTGSARCFPQQQEGGDAKETGEQSLGQPPL